MYDQEILQQLRESWPEPTSYLEQVGQLNNDLMALREMQLSETAAPGWMDQLGIDVEDLTQPPAAAQVLTFLYARGIQVVSASEIPELVELRQDQEQEYQAGYATTPEALEEPNLTLSASTDARVWALPETQQKLREWAEATAQRSSGETIRPLTLAQAVILMRTTQFVDQEPEHSPAWAAECLRSALSSRFFEKAGSPAN